MMFFGTNNILIILSTLVGHLNLKIHWIIKILEFFLWLYNFFYLFVCP